MKLALFLAQGRDVGLQASHKSCVARLAVAGIAPLDVGPDAAVGDAQRAHHEDAPSDPADFARCLLHVFIARVGAGDPLVVQPRPLAIVDNWESSAKVSRNHSENCRGDKP